MGIGIGKIGAGLILAFCTAGAAAASGCAPDEVMIRGPFGKARFGVEVADDGAERARGLMFRENLPASAGMLFVYPAPTRAVFWMKNTLIPLDIIFADETGRVRRVHPNAKPGDLTPIDGGPDIRFVLEIRGGMSEDLGIQPGAELRHPAIPQSTAAWSC